ncbi:hypothetical protein F5884DRAFT_444319 [Xylogone sp. PMI_703]|nr:hypothetical protein F5884DRAFT_444319 [Xylogone sp. PMI_703]
MIRRQRYLLHKSNPDVTILCSSPGIKPFQDVVMSNERVRMSVIFEYEECYETECPKCGFRRPAEFRGVTLICENCNLSLHFQDSHDNTPDPLTSIALEGFRSNGIRKFVQEFNKEASLSEGSSASEIEGNGLHLEGWLRDRLTDLGPGPTAPSRQPKVRHFDRVTVCKPQWPELSYHRSYQRGIECLSKTMDGVERRIRNLNAEDLPAAKFAALLNSRFMNARLKQAVLRFLKSILQAYKKRKPLIVWSQMTARLLLAYIERVDETGAQLHKSVLRTRCLLWIYWDVLRVEGNILLSCSKLLDHWSAPEGYQRRKPTLPMKVFSVTNIAPFIILSRLTVELAIDVGELFAKAKPLYLPSAIQQFVMRPGDIAYNFYLDGNLSNYFRSYAVLGDDIDRKFGLACQRLMYDVMQSEGRELRANQVVQHLREMMGERFI